MEFFKQARKPEYRITRTAEDGSMEYLSRATRHCRGYNMPVWVCKPWANVKTFATMWGAQKAVCRARKTCGAYTYQIIDENNKEVKE